MKRIIPILTILFAAATISCTDFKEEEIPVSFGVDVSDLDFDSASSSRSVTVSSSRRWDIPSMPSWISLGAINQSGHSPYEWIASFSATENDEFNREGIIVIKSGSDFAEISVSQDGKKGKYIAVESVSLSPTELTLTEGETASLKYTIRPANASIQDVVWQSNAPSVATVTAYSGKIEAIAEGRAEISITTTDGNKTAICAVMVKAKVIPVTGVSLDKTSLSLTEGETYSLVATVTPSNATNKSVTWSSSNTTVATVSSSGVVTAKAAGSATITVKTSDGANTATCAVTVNSTWSGEGSENGHDYIDLGLPSGVMWATCNVGASKMEDYGDYYAWGETSTKSEFSWTNYKYRTSGSHESDVRFSKYNSNSTYGTVDNKNTLDLSDDAARVNWGGRWRMPTNSEIQELRTNCSYTWTTLNGISGYKLTSKNNGKSIFLPAAGRWFESSLDYFGEKGHYWSSSLYSSSAFPFYARFLLFDSSIFTDNYHYRCEGRSVRPVFEIACVPVTGVSLNKTSLSMAEGDTYTLSATVSPSNASDNSVTWSSSNALVATVSSYGVVTAKSAGSTVITVTTIDGGKTAICYVTVTSSQVSPEAIDLGLPSGVKWASFNLGATKPEDNGDYFAWGETTRKVDYSWTTYKWCSRSEKLTKYCNNSYYGYMGYTDTKTILDSEDDAAYVKFEGKWRMPASAEWVELQENCTWTWTTVNGVNGHLVTGKNGNSIFLPAAGLRSGTNISSVGTLGVYWSSSLRTADPTYAMDMRFSTDGAGSGAGIDFRYCGFSVRPVYLE